MGLDRGVRLSRLEWAAVRGALGRPRRLSQSFLRQERVRSGGPPGGSAGEIRGGAHESFCGFRVVMGPAHLSRRSVVTSPQLI